MLCISDFHTHILPAMDDGSASVEESIALLELEAAQGVERVVLTPHFYPMRESPAEFLR
jgi:protein-tyrosine phosphatase